MISANHLENLLKSFQQQLPEKKEKPPEKPVVDFYDFYKSKEQTFTITKAISGLNQGEGQTMTASQLLDTGVVFPAPSPSKSGEFLVVLLPSFRQGNLVYTLHNKENKPLKNTIRVKQTSLENYNYIVTEKSEKPVEDLIDISKEKIVNNAGEPVVTPKQKQEYQEYLKKVYAAIEAKKQQNALDPIINAQRSGMISLDVSEISKEKELAQLIDSALAAAKKEQQYADACFSQPQQKSLALFKNLITKAKVKATPTPVCTNTYISFLTKLADVISKVDSPNSTPSAIQTVLEELLDIDVYTGEEDAEKEITQSSIMHEVFQYLGIEEKDYLDKLSKKVPSYVQKIVQTLSALHRREGSSTPIYDFTVRKAVLRAMIVQAISKVAKFDESTTKALKEKLYEKFLRNGQPAVAQIHTGQDKKVLIGKIDIFDADHFYEIMSGYEPLLNRERKELNTAETREYIQAILANLPKELTSVQHAEPYESDVLLFARLMSDSVSRLIKVPMVPNSEFNPAHFVGLNLDKDIVAGKSAAFTMVGTNSSGNQEFDLYELINELSDLSDFENPKINAFVAKTAESFFSTLSVPKKSGESDDDYKQRQQKEKRMLFKAIKMYLSKNRSSFSGDQLDRGDILEALVSLETIYKTISNSNEPGTLHFSDDIGVDALSRYLDCNSNDTYSYLKPSTANLENQESQIIEDFSAAFKPADITNEYAANQVSLPENPLSGPELDEEISKEPGHRLSSSSFIQVAKRLIGEFSKIKDSSIAIGKIQKVLQEAMPIATSPKLRKFLKDVLVYMEDDFEENSLPNSSYDTKTFIKRLQTFLQAYWYSQYSEKPEVARVTGKIDEAEPLLDLRLDQTTIWSPSRSDQESDYGQFTFDGSTYIYGPEGVRTMVTPEPKQDDDGNHLPALPPSEQTIIPENAIDHSLDLNTLFSIELARIIARNSVSSTGQEQPYNLQKTHVIEALEKAKHAVVSNIMEIYLKIAGKKVKLETSEDAQIHLEKLKAQLLDIFYTLNANVSSLSDEAIDTIFTNTPSLLSGYSPVNMNVFSGAQTPTMIKLPIAGATPEKKPKPKPKTKKKKKKTKALYEVENYNDLEVILKAVSKSSKKDEASPPKCPETITQDANGNNVVSFRDSLLYATNSGVHVLNASKSSGLKGAQNGFGDVVNSKITNATYDQNTGKISLAENSEIETDVSEVKVGDKPPSFNSVSRFALATDALHRALGKRNIKNKIAVATTRFKDRRLSTEPADIELVTIGEHRSKLKL